MPDDFKHVKLAAGNVEYRHIRAARPVGDTVIIMLHDGVGCAATWRDIPDRLADATGCDVIVPSRFGYGGSDPCELPRPLDYMQTEGRDIVPDLVGALGIGRHIVVGHSDGGSIALVYAGAEKRPGLLGVATIAAHVFCEQICVDAVGQAVADFEAGPLRDALARYHGDNVDCAFSGWAGAWADPGFKDWNIEQFLPGIDVPAIVIQGRQDEYGTLAQVDRIVSGIGNAARPAVIEECGHAPHREQADKLLVDLVEFAGKLIP